MFFFMENFEEKSFREDREHHQVSDDHRVRSDDAKGKDLVLRSLDSDQNKDLDRSRVCNICGKRFLSGQALGGHKSIHFQPRLGPDKMNKFKVTQQQQVQYYPPSNYKISCDVCNKSFPSAKSLYGHMASHRRTVQSSPSSSSSSFTEYDYSEDDDRGLVQKEYYGPVLPGWPKKDRRGKMSTANSSRSDSLIAKHTPNNYNNDFASKYHKFASSKKVKFSYGFKHDRHVCNICYRKFPTGQALGGHKRAHYFNDEAEPILKAPPASKIKVASTEDHEDGKTIDPVGASSLMQLAEEAIHLQSRRTLDLDLNKPPPDDE